MKTLSITAIMLTAILLISHQVSSMDKKTDKKMNSKPQKTQLAVFAGGCFWCTESDFEKVDGVIEASSGYTGGHVANPTYKQVSKGATGHVEAVRVVYDPEKVTYEQLLEVFWRHVNPTDAGGQFVDRGAQYRSAIFYVDDQQRLLAEASKKNLSATGPFDKSIVTDILPLGEFYLAEDYHQDYYKKNPIRYHWYRSGSGRDKFLKSTWKNTPSSQGDAMEKTGMPGDKVMEKQGNSKTSPDSGRMEEKSMVTSKAASRSTTSSNEELRHRLTPIQYKVTRQNGTEPPFNNRYWNNHQAGIYVDIVSGEPLFSSTDKFESGTGWPSFIRPLEPENIVEKTDRSFLMTRTEVRSKHADSHLGHVFNDGPKPTGLRYCINSAALLFIPAGDLKKEGYGKYRKLFE